MPSKKIMSVRRRTEKKAKSRKKLKKRKSRKTLRKYGGGDVFKGCARCETLFESDENPLGGGFSGVICYKHRSCKSCWFGPELDTNWGLDAPTKGERNKETNLTKNIPLTKDPFRKRIPHCPGCYKNLPPFNYTETIGKENSGGFIEID